KGFRGEALASIAAVAEVDLFTRRPQDTLGTHVKIAFGKKLLVEPTRCASGTTIIVQKLFHKLPVRRKSLRSDLTEHRHNLQEFFRLVFPHPERAFQYYHNEALIYDLPPTSPIQRILAIHPELNEKDIVQVEETTPFFSLHGWLVIPESTPAQNREGFLFINRRFIRHPSIQQAIVQVYKPLLREEQRPLYWIFLEVNPAQVDVNVTPSKTEARLLHEVEIRTMLQSIIRRALARVHLALPSDWLEKSTATIASLPPLPLHERVTPPPSRLPLLSGSLEASPPSATSYLILYGRYMVLKREEEVWLIDLVRAYQRILYEKYKRSLSLTPQGLLFPVHAPLTPMQSARLAEMTPLLSQIGLHIEIREGREAVLHSVPAGVSPSAASTILEGVLQLTDTDTLPESWQEKIVQHIVHHGIPRPPYNLAPEAVESLWEELQRCAEPEYSPAGHRIRFLISRDTLEGLFRR
ncbi:MAG: DNA mismatch repair endonuclease MutL, partial [Anaerolineae bacterium]|uniref:DNA mismatch repair endonuclease MutL n=1 Tax=Thermoflexus sp. TaxID=1969742 RepID=UPI0025CDC500